jgi:hypothetical protein
VTVDDVFDVVPLVVCVVLRLVLRDVVSEELRDVLALDDRDVLPLVVRLELRLVLRDVDLLVD